MGLRARHGRSKQLGGVGPVVEVLPPDEQPQAQGSPPLARDAKGRVTGSEAARRLAKLPRRSRFLPRKITCDPRFEPHNEQRREWQRKRLGELADAHGAVSYGVGAMLNAAAWLYAGSEFAAQTAAETGNLELFKLAGSLSSTARGHELGAWELSAREAAARNQGRNALLASIEAEADNARLTEGSQETVSESKRRKG